MDILQIQIRQILWDNWDPICIKNIAYEHWNCEDEYDAYADTIFDVYKKSGILVENEVFDFLIDIAKNHIGLIVIDEQQTKFVAEKITQLIRNTENNELCQNMETFSGR